MCGKTTNMLERPLEDSKLRHDVSKICFLTSSKLQVRGKADQRDTYHQALMRES
jgi:hypothetical protein